MWFVSIIIKVKKYYKIDEDVEDDTHIMDTCTKCHALFYKLVLYMLPTRQLVVATGVVKYCHLVALQAAALLQSPSLAPCNC